MITNKDFMLCESTREEDLYAFKNEGNWKANIKFDGERIVVIKNNDDVFLLNRAGRIKNQIYPEVIPSIKKIKGNFILDGEVITTNGIFNSLQHRSNLSDKNKIERAKIDYPIKYMVFDLLFFEKDIRQMPLKERIKLLQDNFGDKLNLVEYQEIDVALNFAKEHKLEGIVIKYMPSIYEGKRSKYWIKMKLFKETPFKAISYTINNAGIRVEDNLQNACQISGQQHIEVRNEIDDKGFCDIVIQYLEKTKDERYRFISFKEKAR